MNIAKVTITLESSGGGICDHDLDVVEDVLDDIRFLSIVKQALEKRLGRRSHKIKSALRIEFSGLDTPPIKRTLKAG